MTIIKPIAIATLALALIVSPSCAKANHTPKPTIVRLINQSPRLTADDVSWMAEALTEQLNADYRAYYHERKPILVVVGGRKGFPVTLTDSLDGTRGLGTAEGINMPHKYAKVLVQGFQGFADGPKPLVGWPALSATTAIADHEIEEGLSGEQIADDWEGWAYYVDGLQMADFALPRKAARQSALQASDAHFCALESYCWKE